MPTKCGIPDPALASDGAQTAEPDHPDRVFESDVVNNLSILADRDVYIGGSGIGPNGDDGTQVGLVTSNGTLQLDDSLKGHSHLKSNDGIITIR